MQEAAFGSEVVLAGLKCYGLLNQLREDSKNSEKVAANVAKIQAAAEDFWKDYDHLDQEVTAAMFRMIHADVEPALHPSVMKTIQTAEYKNLTSTPGQKRCSAPVSLPTASAWTPSWRSRP